MKRNIIIISIFIAALFILSCEEEGGNETKVSQNGLMESHNMGQNCMNCHKSGGEGEGWFNVAGTVYDSLKTKVLPNGKIELYTGPDGTGDLKYTIQVDGKGNFYTTENIDFGTGLYATASGPQGSNSMGSAITSGHCNGCHGVNTDKIWTK